MLDTTIIQNNYFLADDNNEDQGQSVGDNQNDKGQGEIDKFKYSVGDNHMYRVSPVKVIYFISFDYGDVDLHIFQFIELDEEGEPLIPDSLEEL
jgi:hypothetical protein